MRRALPNRIEVEITERTPVAFVREASDMALVDAHGVILERPLGGNFHFPVVTGITDGMPLEIARSACSFSPDSRSRLNRPTGAVDQVSEVDLSDEHDVRATLTVRPVGAPAHARFATAATRDAPVLVHFGDSDFAGKYQTLVEILASGAPRRGHRVGGFAVQPRGSRESGHGRRGATAAAETGCARAAKKSRRRSRIEERADLTKKERHIVALDIGSTKTCALIGELDDDGGVKFAALGAAESKGWRKGQIVNLDLAVSSIRRAVEEAETIVGVPVESAMIGVAGGHVRGVNSRGGITVGAKPRDVQRDDVRRAIEAARGVTLPEDREVLHVLPQEFSLDAQDNIRDAIGMVGQRLEANVHIVTASGTATQNIVTAVNRAGVRVDDTVLEPFAAAEACLTQDERELGCCLLDIGGGTTELIAYTGGVVRHTAAIPVGGDHFTNDLAVGLRTPIPEAEKIKREHAQRSASC